LNWKFETARLTKLKVFRFESTRVVCYFQIQMKHTGMKEHQQLCQQPRKSRIGSAAHPMGSRQLGRSGPAVQLREQGGVNFWPAVIQDRNFTANFGHPLQVNGAGQQGFLLTTFR
jgi:hypothetical protein